MSDPTDIRRVGYIGLGIMGAPMAGNLMDAGYEMVVWNRTASKMQPLVKRGATAAESPADVARRGARVIFTNVSDTPDVEAVLFGDNGVADGVSEDTSGGEGGGLIVVDHSTISPTRTQEFAERLAKQGVTLLDAPVSGGDVGAKAGTLSIMVGGPPDAVARCMPLFEVVGKNIVHVGGPGMGQVCKACNQVCVTVTLMGVCEALALAKKSGLDPDVMIQAISGGAAGSWQLSNLGPKITAGDFDPGFMIDLVLKDLRIVAESAKQHGLPLDAATLVQSRYQHAQHLGHGKSGTQAMAKAYEDLGKMSFGE